MSDTPNESPPDVGTPRFDETQVRMAMERFREEQSLAMGAVGGGLAAAIGASVWAAITVTLGFQIGWMAVGVGFLVGYAVRRMGKGITPIFGIVGASLALLGCLVGNYLSVVGAVANHFDIGYFDALARTDVATAQELMFASFSPIDLLFYGIAVWEGWKLSPRTITDADIAEKITGTRPLGEGRDGS